MEVETDIEVLKTKKKEIHKKINKLKVKNFNPKLSEQFGLKRKKLRIELSKVQEEIDEYFKNKKEEVLEQKNNQE